MKKLLVIGSDSNLAKYIIEDLKKSKLSIYRITRKEVDFDTTKSKSILKKYLKKINPDIIINCVGIFKDNNFSFKSIFNINTKVGWDLIDYYRIEMKKKVKIIFIGSSAYNKPRKNYILYVASKSALNSMVISAKDLFLNTNIELSIINPPAMKSKMRNKFYKNDKLKKQKLTIEIDPRIISKKIIRKF